MTWTIADARARLGLQPAVPPDATVQAALDAARAIAETWCGRRFLRARETVLFHWPFQRAMQLPRFPVESVVAMTATHGTTPQALPPYQVNGTAGQVVFQHQVAAREIHIDYVGGFDPLPPDLEAALWLILDSLWATTPGWGATAGGGGALAGSVIERITVPDVGTIQFANTGTGGEAAGSAGGAMEGIAPPAALALLELYRVRLC